MKKILLNTSSIALIAFTIGLIMWFIFGWVQKEYNMDNWDQMTRCVFVLCLIVWYSTALKLILFEYPNYKESMSELKNRRAWKLLEKQQNKIEMDLLNHRIQQIHEANEKDTPSRM